MDFLANPAFQAVLGLITDFQNNQNFLGYQAGEQARAAAALEGQSQLYNRVMPTLYDSAIQDMQMVRAAAQDVNRMASARLGRKQPNFRGPTGAYGHLAATPDFPRYQGVQFPPQFSHAVAGNLPTNNIKTPAQQQAAALGGIAGNAGALLGGMTGGPIAAIVGALLGTGLQQATR